MRKVFYHRAGFSLIELLISIAIVTIITVSAIPAYQVFSRRNTLVEGTSAVVSAIARAELLSRGVSQNTGWGVIVETSSVVIFNGASFASSTASLSQTTRLPSGLIVSGTPTFAFTKFYGFPQATGSIVLGVPGVKSSTITINAKGLATY